MSTQTAEEHDSAIDNGSLHDLIASTVQTVGSPRGDNEKLLDDLVTTPAPMSLRAPNSGPISVSGPAINHVGQTMPRGGMSLMPPSATASREEALATHVNRNDWQTVARQLGPLNESKALSPTLGLLAALAHNEAMKNGSPESVAVAIRCTAKLLGVPEESPIARVIARRLLRKNPTGISEREAPPAKTGITIIVMVAFMGAAVGWLLSGGWGVVRALVLKH